METKIFVMIIIFMLIFFCFEGYLLIDRIVYITCYINMQALGFAKESMCTGNFSDNCIKCPYYKGGQRIV